MEEWLKDSFGTIAVLVYLLYPLLRKWLEKRKKRAEQREQAEGGQPAAEQTGPAPETRRQRRGERAAQRRAEQLGKPRAKAPYRAPKQRARGRGEERRQELQAQAVTRLQSQLDRARGEALALIELIGPAPVGGQRGEHPLAQLAEPLRRDLLPGIESIRKALKSDPTMATVREQTGVLADIEANLSALRGLIEQRLSSTASVLADVDVIARDSYAPFISFAQTQSIPLAERTPVSVRGPFDRDRFTSTAIAPIRVPSGFSRQVWGWPSIVHDVCHDIFFSVEHLALDLYSRLGLTRQLPAPSSELELQVGFPRVLFGPWLPEIFADLLATLMLGPSYVESLLHTLASPRAPQRSSAIMTDRGFIAEEPPARLRLYMSCRALAYMGYQAQSEALWSRWEGMHPNAQLFFFPLAGNWVGLSEDALTNPADELVELMLGEPWPELAGYRLSAIPDLSFAELEEAEVRNLSARLREGAVVDADARWVVAAAVTASAEAEEQQPQILRAARRALSPGPVVEAVEPVVEKRAPASSIKAELRRSVHDPAAVREAVVLGSALCPRPSARSRQR